MTSNEGAILILPEGASLFELEDKELQKIREYAARYALQWCRSANQDTLYLITAMVKSKSWTSGSFHYGFRGSKIFVHRQLCGDSVSYDWICEAGVDDPVTPINNSYLNQTVFIKGFKMTVRTRGAEKATWWPLEMIARVCE